MSAPEAPRGPDALRPCPFCGCDWVRVDSEEDGAFFVRCPDCGAEGPITLVAEHAKQEWNDRRAAPSAGAGRAAELADALDEMATTAEDFQESCAMEEAAGLLRSRAAPLDREVEARLRLLVLGEVQQYSGPDDDMEGGWKALREDVALALAALAHPEIKA